MDLLLAAIVVLGGLAAAPVAQQPMPAGTPEPPVAGPNTLQTELTRFPPPAVALYWAVFASEHWKWAESRSALNSDRAWWPAYVSRCERRLDAWLALLHAHTWGEHDTAWQLEQLRDLIGREAYEAGRMPAPAPFLDDIWRR